MAASQAERVIDIRVLETIEELEACVEMQRLAWGFSDLDLVPRRVFVVARKIGGQVLGAWAGNQMVGFTMALPGHRPGQTYWHSHMLAVLPQFRDRGLGRKLKLRQREEALAQGLDLIEWTFDPLEVKNGYFNLHGLGAITRHYHPNLYGLTSSALQGGLPTDRLTAEWWLRTPRVAAVARGEAPPAARITQEIPVSAEIEPWKQARDPRAAAAQTAIREKMQAGFAAGLTAVGYRRTPEGGAFLLGVEEPA
ncbi:MAG TPA: GNAT family N-acetyltransferase [Terriglobales bacterium]